MLSDRSRRWTLGGMGLRRKVWVTSLPPRVSRVTEWLETFVFSLHPPTPPVLTTRSFLTRRVSLFSRGVHGSHLLWTYKPTYDSKSTHPILRSWWRFTSIGVPGVPRPFSVTSTPFLPPFLWHLLSFRSSQDWGCLGDSDPLSALGLSVRRGSQANGTRPNDFLGVRTDSDSDSLLPLVSPVGSISVVRWVTT